MSFFNAMMFAPVSCEDLNSSNLSIEMKYQVDSRLNGITDSNGKMKLYSTRATNTGTWVKNQDVWTNNGEVPLDFSGQSVWNSTGGYTRSGTLISPRHIIFANHYQISNGATVIFIDSNGQTVSRTLVSKADVVGNDGEDTDITVGLLNSDVPDTVAYYPILTEDQLGQSFYGADTPVVIFDQEDKVIVSNLYRVNLDLCNYAGELYCQQKLFSATRPMAQPTRDLFHESITDGDSGNPMFLIINNKPTIVSHNLFAGSGSGPFYAHYLSEINSAMADLNDAYSASTYDTSCFIDVNMQPTIAPVNPLFVNENAVNGTTVGDILSTSSYEPVYYSILRGNDDNIFQINQTTGRLTVANSADLNYSKTQTYSLTIQAMSDGNSGFNSSNRTSNTSVTVNILPDPVSESDIFYFYSTSSTDWGTVGNWYSDYNHTVLAGRIPNSANGVVITGSIIPIANLATWTSPAYINTKFSSGLTFSGSGTVTVNIVGKATFSSSAKNGGRIIGDVTFNANCINNGTVDGNVTFNDSYNNTAGVINGNAVFTSTSSKKAYNNGTVNGDANFNSLSVLGTGVVSGNATLTGVTTNTFSTSGNWGTVRGTVKGLNGQTITNFIFTGAFARNYGVVPGSATFDCMYANMGEVDGNATYKNISGTSVTFPFISSCTEDYVYEKKTSVHGYERGDVNQIITSWVFNENSYNTRDINNSTVTFNGPSGGAIYAYNSGSIKNSTVIFNGYSQNRGTITGLRTTFNNNSFNCGDINSVVVFNDSAFAGSRSVIGLDTQYSDIFGDVNLNGSSINGLDSTITGNLIINGSSAYNWGHVTGNAVYTSGLNGTLTLSNYYGSISGTVKGGDNLDINNWVFNSGAGNYGTTGITTFNGTSSNHGTTLGLTTFNDSSYNYSSASSIVDSDAIFNNSSTNRSKVNGSATFNGNLSENYYTSYLGSVLGTKKRVYSSDIDVSDRNFIDGNYWTIVADGAVVTMLDSTKYDERTIFKTENGGSFVGPNIHGLLDTNVTSSGFNNSDLNITVSDQNLFEKKFIGVKTVQFKLQDRNLMSFDYNFSANDLNLSKISIIKDANYLIVDLNGQIPEGETKTIYLTDLNYTDICVKDAKISSIDEISYNCEGENEYYFEKCIGGTQTINQITCTDLGNEIKIDGLRNSAIQGRVVFEASSSGGSCTPLWDCSLWSECIDGNQTRTCTKLNNCGSSVLGKPIEMKPCAVEEVINSNANTDNNNSADNNIGITDSKETENNNSDTNQIEQVSKEPKDANNEEPLIQNPVLIILLLVVLVILSAVFLVIKNKPSRSKLGK